MKKQILELAKMILDDDQYNTLNKLLNQNIYDAEVYVQSLILELFINRCNDIPVRYLKLDDLVSMWRINDGENKIILQQTE